MSFSACLVSLWLQYFKNFPTLLVSGQAGWQAEVLLGLQLMPGPVPTTTVLHLDYPRPSLVAHNLIAAPPLAPPLRHQQEWQCPDPGDEEEEEEWTLIKRVSGALTGPGLAPRGQDSRGPCQTSECFSFPLHARRSLF